MDDLTRAKEILQTGQLTFVLMKEGRVIKTSHKGGIIPLIEVIKQDDRVLDKAVIADKVIGRAAALLAVHYKVRAIYAELISQKAREILDKHSIFYQFKQCVPYIKNRELNDQCPLEKLTQSISDPAKAYDQILQFYQETLKINI
jgi:hypothetical protein